MFCRVSRHFSEANTMEFGISKGFLMVLLLCHCTSEGMSTIGLETTPSTPQDKEAPSDEVALVVAPPNLRDVQQAVQEASEQVEGHGAKQVLKELLERVVEAALGQREGETEGKRKEEAEEDATKADIANTDADTEAESLDHAVAEDMHAKDGVISVKEEQMAEINVLGDVAGDWKDPGEGDTVVRDETAGGVETAGSEEVTAEVIDESLGAEVNQGDVVETAVPSKEAGGDSAEDGVGLDRNDERLEEEVGGEALSTEGAEQKTDEFSLGADDVWPGEDGVQVETQVGLTEGDGSETKELVGEEPSTAGEINKSTNSVAEDSQGGNNVAYKDDKKMEEEAERGSDIKEVSEDPIFKEGHQQPEELETLHGSEGENHETPLISAPVAEEAVGAPLEQSLKLQTPIQSPAPGEEVKRENAPLEEKHVGGNDIMTPRDDLLADSFVAEPALDNYVKVAQPLEPGTEPGQNNEEESLTTEALKAWKIGAIAAATFLVLETVFIIVYIIDRQNKNSTRASHRSCEEGSLEPEAATGGDCSDETLPASNGDTQQMLSIDPSEAASTLAQKDKGRHEEQQVTNMENLPLGTTDGVSNTVPGSDISEQE